MADRFMKTVLTPSVLEAEKYYYGKTYPEPNAPETDLLGEREFEMIQSRDSFYMATVTENGWPYIQHRGGPEGFLRVIDSGRIGFADYSGNRQMISVGSLAVNARISLFLTDYPRKARLKVLGEAQVLDARDRSHSELAQALTPPGGHASVPERLFLIDVLSYDWNCRQYITPRFRKEEVDLVIDPLRSRITELEEIVSGYERQI